MASRDTSLDSILRDLKNQIYSPLYLLFGEEPYFIDLISDSIEQGVLSDQEKEFNQTIVYGRDISVPTLISYARRFPMMANYQVLIVKEAQELDKIDELVPYAESPLSSTILVICYKYGKPDKRKSLYKTFDKHGVTFESARLYDNQIPDWITAFAKKNGYGISPKAALLLTEFVGNELSKVVNELGKLFINLPAGSLITEDHIERNIGISKDFNVFELQKALSVRDVYKSNLIIRHFAANPRENPLVKVIPMLYSHFSRILQYHFLQDKSKNTVASEFGINPFFVADYQQAARNYPPAKVIRVISLLREYDLKAKGVDNASTPDGELMREMVFRILH